MGLGYALQHFGYYYRKVTRVVARTSEGVKPVVNGASVGGEQTVSTVLTERRGWWSAFLFLFPVLFVACRRR
jgi:hypothetical protein